MKKSKKTTHPHCIPSALQHYQSGNLHQAEHLFKKALVQKPDDPDILYFLGIIHAQSENYDLAIHYIKKSIQFHTGNLDAYLALGMALQKKGLIDDAIHAYMQLLKTDPNSAEAYFHAGNLLQQKKQYDDAIAYFHKAIRNNPSFIQAYHGLAGALVNKWRLDEAIHVCQKILQINPSDVLAYYILGNTLMTQGKTDEAELWFKKAILIKPDEVKVHQALLMLTSYLPRFDGHAVLSEHLHFAEQFEESLYAQIAPHAHDRSSNRRLKIGYVSPDFQRHSVAYFIEPVLINHNRDSCEIFCYSDVSTPDEVTDRIEKYAEHFINIAGLPDAEAAESIHREKIDVLVDLAGHTGGVNRILLFARKPAPVQASWIGYPSTTGLSTIDYKIVDGYTDPVGISEQCYSEKLIRLPESFLCYLPDNDCPDIGNPPVSATGHITFGSLNNFVKVGPQVIALWSKILKILPNSRLILKSLSFFDKATRSYARESFLHEGIRAERVDFLEPCPSPREHLRIYNQIDIGLDPFPYNGTTTTCEALWMGVPVITLEGTTHASRVGVSLLSNIGLSELIAKSQLEYVEKAAALSIDIEKLQTLRKDLRRMMTQSPLMEAKQFTLNLEACYRRIWETWCTTIERVN
ncbi:MAG: tetratricopeptide repeat protein [Thermodesulfovibrionales bacterium]|nr:tetratricopeptide repeat protein [Thermodesulfovibrionales bacterium]